MKLFFFFLSFIIADAQEISIAKSWNLLGATQDLNASFFRADCADAVWTYDNGFWKSFVHTKEATTQPPFSIAKGKGFWVYSKLGDCRLSTSIQTWYRYKVPNERGGWSNDITKKDGKYIAIVNRHVPDKQVIQYNSTLISSRDGVNWNNMNIELPGQYAAILATEKYIYAVGWNPRGGSPSENPGSIIRSLDGYNWEEIYVSKNMLYNIVKKGDNFIAAGRQTIVTSEDGINWIEKNYDDFFLFKTIAYSQNEVLLSGDTGVVISSKDMKNWNFLDTVKNNSYGIQNSLFANNLFLMFADRKTLIYDGKEIKYIPWNSVSYSNEVVYKNRFLSLQDNNVSISNDGVTWTKIAELKIADENTTNLNFEDSFASDNNIIFPQK